MKRFAICLAAFLLASPVSVAAAKRSCSSDSAKQEVAGTIRSFFAALAADDEEAVRRLTTPGFYAFDVGKRYSGPELSKAVADAHRSGRTIEWNIGPVDARVDCAYAFAAWENVGAAGTAPNLQPRTWLESALLVRRDGRWLIDFLHSTPKDPRN
ncbi:MAG TPA: DUF4440 domain-containing protein [Allosphingosinicella sp.]|nr:DUF4440 domain-containing protein [Allosphingosinicella sp.]